MKTLPLGVMEALALEAATYGYLGDYPRTAEVLHEAGLVDDNGSPTPAGLSKLAEHRKALNDDAFERNVVINVSADSMIVLGKLLAGESVGDVGDLRRTSLVERTREGWRITDTGRRAYSVGAGRTY